MTEFRKKKKKYPYPFLRQFHADGRFSTRVHHQLRFLINAKNGSDGKKKEREREWRGAEARSVREKYLEMAPAPDNL